MESVGLLIPEDKFCHIQMPGDFPIDSDSAAPFVEQAVELADLSGKTVHIQNTNGFTIHIVHPEDRTTN